MAQPQIGATIDELERADQRSADPMRRSLGTEERVQLWAIGLDDQVVAVSQEHAFIVKWGFAAGAPLGGRVLSLRFEEIVSVDVRLGSTTGIFEIRATGMPVWIARMVAWQAPRTLSNEQDAAAMVFLCTDEASVVNGARIPLTGRG